MALDYLKIFIFDCIFLNYETENKQEKHLLKTYNL